MGETITFNPFGKFNVQHAIRAHPTLSPGAKLAYAALADRNAKGRCFPSMATTGKDIGLSQVQAQRHVRALIEGGFLRSTFQFKDGRQTSNTFEFLWHPWFEEYGLTLSDMGGGSASELLASPVSELLPSPVSKTIGEEENHKEESHKEDSHVEEDLDFPPADRVRDPRAGVLFKCLASYMGKDPTENTLEAVRAAARRGNGSVVSDEEIVAELESKKQNYSRANRHGPRSWNWFPTTVLDEFSKIRAARERRELPATAPPFEEIHFNCF